MPLIGPESDSESSNEEEENIISSLVPLTNKGNQCYMIATFQLLTLVHHLWKWLADEDKINLPLVNPLEKEIILKTATLLLGGLISAEFNRAVEKGGIPKTIKFDTLNEARKVALPYS